MDYSTYEDILFHKRPLEALAPEPSSTLLDLGCGDGNVARVFKEKAVVIVSKD